MRALASVAALLLGQSLSSVAWGQPTPTAPAAPASPAGEPAAPPEAATPGSNATEPPPELPPGYYVEPAPRPAPPASSATAAPETPESREPPPSAPVYEPPPPGAGPVYEPPPPPQPHHLGPRTSLWLGARLGWFFPFGSLYARSELDQYNELILRSVPWTDYLSSGPSFELDAGARLARHYNVFVLWERAELGSGSAEKHAYGGQQGGDTDYFALGLRATSEVDAVGLLTELALGYRQARAYWKDGTELRQTGGILEGRVGIGAELRLSPVFTLEPLLEVGVGSFDRVRQITPGGGSFSRIGPNDESGSHGWVTLGVGGHADLFGAD